MSLVAKALLALPLALPVGCGPERAIRGAETPVHFTGAPERAFGRQFSFVAADIIYRGELVACEEGAVFVQLNERGDDTRRRLPLSAVREIRLEESEARADIVAWTVVGALSGASHGFWSVISVPIWAGVGVPSAVSAGPPELRPVCMEIGPYSRFPQGLPKRMAERFAGPGGASVSPPPPPPLPMPPPPPLEPPASPAPATDADAGASLDASGPVPLAPASPGAPGP